MQVMDGLFDDLRVLEKEQQLELQELENEPMELARNRRQLRCSCC